MLPDLDDDDLSDLPAMPPLGSGEETGVEDAGYDPTAGSGGPEEVGLDDAEGFDEALDAVQFLDLVDDEPTALDLSEAGDEIGDLGQTIDDDGGEYGWTDDTEAPSRDEWNDGPLIAPPKESTVEDDGALGMDDDEALAFDGEDVLHGLPDLDRTDDSGDSDDLELGDVFHMETFSDPPPASPSMPPPPPMPPTPPVPRIDAPDPRTDVGHESRGITATLVRPEKFTLLASGGGRLFAWGEDAAISVAPSGDFPTGAPEVVIDLTVGKDGVLLVSETGRLSGSVSGAAFGPIAISQRVTRALLTQSHALAWRAGGGLTQARLQRGQPTDWEVRSEPVVDVVPGEQADRAYALIETANGPGGVALCVLHLDVLNQSGLVNALPSFLPSGEWKLFAAGSRMLAWRRGEVWALGLDGKGATPEASVWRRLPEADGAEAVVVADGHIIVARRSAKGTHDVLWRLMDGGGARLWLDLHAALGDTETPGGFVLGLSERDGAVYVATDRGLLKVVATPAS